MTGLGLAVEKFTRQYNLLEKTGGSKNSRFGVFYTELVDAIAASLGINITATRTAFLYLIGVLVAQLHEGDVTQNGFNVLRLTGGDNYQELLPKDRPWEMFVAAMYYVERADAALKHCSFPAVSELLSFYLEGELAGLEMLEEFEFFAGMSGEERTKVTRILLKPHPWERYTKEEVTTWCQMNQTLLG